MNPFEELSNACMAASVSIMRLEFTLWDLGKHRLPRKLKKEYKKRFGDNWVNFIK